MASWVKGQIIPRKTEPYPGYPNWELVDCGCCNGTKWGGDYPRECNHCNGSGAYARHIKSQVHAAYPGGPFC